MINRARREQLLAARRARQGAIAAATRRAELCAELRSFFYPKQRAFFCSRHRRKATNKTRRSGATAGGCRELIARAIETPRFRAVYATTTRIEAKARAWLNDTQSGLVDVLRRYGTQLDDGGVDAVDMAGVRVDIRTGELALVFSNGSLIELFGADDEAAVNKLRGLAKHVFWVDEAQDFTWLERLYKSVITAGATDFEGEVWLTGTPGRDCAGFFYEVTRDDEPGLPGWEVHRIAVVDNPFFGRVMWEAGEWFVVDNLYGRPGNSDDDNAAHRYGPFASESAAEEAAIKVRWDRTAGAAIIENEWDEDDPDLLREWYARWVKDDARFVYAAHSVPEHELCYAPMRFADDGFPDVRLALLDLPGWHDGREYFLGVGADLGTTRAFGWSMWGWSMMDPVFYEIASWKKTGLDYDEMAGVLRAVGDQATIGLWVADAGGGGKPAVKGWSRKWVDRYQLPIIEATKPNKALAIKQFNTDIRKRHVQMRTGSPLLAEWKVHRWLPLRGAGVDSDMNGGQVEDPRTHRDLSDAALYIHRESYHHRFREEPPKCLPNTPEWVLREERELEASNLAEIEGPYAYR